ncbi:ABC transporter permease [Roseisalinus antarcticus]|uniref:Putrescine transport system permease protein PotH n=1 Tax=Roseisalinus antarcticus TaxID=254357 RepID=A0A1Y5RF25_9RHOB|nr:ABC transporter permease [Roseisalinus antarcticus]SLN15983.1 Putrescine transport system permease protein PotH [Roseisalinus antarcticus]
MTTADITLDDTPRGGPRPASSGPRPASSGPRPASSGRRTAWLLLSPALAFFAVLFLMPLAVMLLFSLLTGNPLWDDTVTFTLENYTRMVQDTYYLEAVGSTVLLGLYVTGASLAIAYPLALQLARMRSAAWRSILMIAVLSPMMTGMVIRTFAWMTLLADQGVINRTLTGAGLIAEPLPLMYNTFGIVVAMTHIFVPFMVLTLVGVLGRIDDRLEQAAQSLGATRLRAFVEVTLPLSVPGILAGSLLVFALTISSYVTPTLMGGFAFVNLPILIYQQIASSFNPSFAAALGFALLVLSMSVIAAYWRVLSRVGRGGGT